MNERIKELKQQALHWSGENVNRNLYSNYEIEQKEYEKFAQLIVAECLGIVDDAERGGSNDIWDNAVKFIRRDLQEHFGVEE